MHRQKKPTGSLKMATNAERGGRVLGIGLAVSLIILVIISANKLRTGIVAVSTTTEYEDKRVMPSISVCFPFTKSDYQGNELEEVVQKTLNDSR